MAQIAFRPKYKKKDALTSGYLSHAAWQFAYAALWQEQHFYPKETAQVKQQIKTYFEEAENKQEAFTAFCERIALVNRMLAAEKSRLLPHPSIWFNRHFREGFAATLSLYRAMQCKQQQIPGFSEGICTVARYYWQYIQKPSGKAFINCRKKLLHLREYGLIQLFYNSIIYSQLLNPAQ